jgi:dGTPase
MYKTQVFVNSQGDPYRTRLSHSLEVCQVARSVGTALRLNGPLCEALALAHDIGHPPFGHRGEWALDEQMRGHGGFRHNVQVLRVVDKLERRSPAYPGLNLTREVRESLLKHEAESDWPESLAPRPERPLLEAQVVDIADSTAYNKHDLEDGLLAGMFTESELERECELWSMCVDRVEARHPGFRRDDDPKLRVQRVANELIGVCIVDLIESSLARIEASGVTDVQQVRQTRRTLVGHGEALTPLVSGLQQFLHQHFYRHEHLQRFLEYAREVLGALFESYRDLPEELPEWYRSWSAEVGLERAICDYLAGMTDRFAQAEAGRLVSPHLQEFPRSL